MRTTCKWYNVCPVKYFTDKKLIDKNWTRIYCKSNGNWEKCIRYQMEENGEYHPDNMLPDGTIDKSLHY